MSTQSSLFSLSGVPPQMLEVLARMHEDSPDRWIPRRAVFANWWLFEHPEEIHFGRGNLMLTGKNESGKTTVLVALLTLVLDRMTSPHRIDTTGEAIRTVRYYLVGEDEATEDHPFYREERTGYVALEFERGSSGQFITVGIALRTNRKLANRDVNAWSFIIRDGRRVNIDVNLMNPSDGKPLDIRGLRADIGDGGQVFDQKQSKEYQEAVNEALFGFSDSDFHRYLDILHVIRKPKLGAGLKPEKVSALLVESLPDVDRKPIEAASDSFRKIDTIEDEIRRLDRQLTDVQQLDEAQVESVHAWACVDALALEAAYKAKQSATRKLDQKEGELAAARETLKEAETDVSAAGRELHTLAGELEPLEKEARDHEAFNAREELRLAEEQLGREDRERKDMQDDLERDRRTAERTAREIDNARTKWNASLADLKRDVSRFRDAAEGVHWTELVRRCRTCLESLNSASLEMSERVGEELYLGTVEGEAAIRRGALERVIEATDVLEAAMKRKEDVDQAVKRAKRNFDRAEGAYTEARTGLDDAREAAANALRSWYEDRTAFPDADEAFEKVLARLEAWHESTVSAAEITDPLSAPREDHQADLEDRIGDLRIREKTVDTKISDLRATLIDLEGRESPVPERTPGQEAARARLEEAGIPFAPLFQAADFRPGTLSDEEAARLEEALIQAGLLDSLVVPRERIAEVSRLLEPAGLGDRWITPTQEAGEHPWLEPVVGDGLSAEDIHGALAALHGGKSALLPEGAWRLGALSGRAEGTREAARFIGEKNQRREIERLIQETQQELSEAEEELAAVRSELSDLQDSLRTLRSEWKSLVGLRELARIGSQLAVLADREEARAKMKNEYETTVEQDRIAREAVREREGERDRAAARVPYAGRRTSADLREIRSRLDVVVQRAEWLIERLAALSEGRASHGRLQEEERALRERITEKAARVHAKEDVVAEVKQKVEVLRARAERESLSLGDLETRIKALGKRKETLESRKKTSEGKIIEASTTIAHIEADLGDYEDQVRSRTIDVQEAEVAFSRTVSSHQHLEGQKVLGEREGWTSVMHEFLAETEPSTAQQKAESAYTRLLDEFQKSRAEFGEYVPTLGTDRIVRFSHPAGSYTTHDLLHHLEAEVEVKRAARDEEDRRIIERVFLRDITDATQKAIHETASWIKDVSEVLEGMEIFKGRSLRLTWKVREKATMDQYDPKRLNELFTQRGIGLSDHLREEMVDIFRAMIGDARRRADEQDQPVDYQAVLEEMLDYKKWYTLTIERKDETGVYRSLTRKRHGEGSIGRRTLDLLLPLIAAVYARLKSAAPAAPRLIGFDEAFAGVDKHNAGQIFGLLSELGMSWIMATEKAADYSDKVPGVTTYEFINDGSVVAPTASVWDGRVTHSFDPDDYGILAATPEAKEVADA
jgi:hypothetical protein